MTLERYSIAAVGASDSAFELPLPGAGAEGPRAFLSSLAAGDMSLRTADGNERRAAWLSRLGCRRPAAAPNMAHTRRALLCPSSGEAPSEEADGFVTGSDGPALVVTVADCMPILLYDLDSGAYAALHSGWKGTGILAEGLRLLADRFGAQPSRVAATFGPHIGSCCYAVDEARARAFAAEFGEASAELGRDGRYRLKLKEANLALAERLGLGHVAVADDCTACSSSLGSYRRQGPEAFTRMAVAVGYGLGPVR